jgi:hypothetical protein
MTQTAPLRSLLLAALFSGAGATATAAPAGGEGWAWWPGDSETFSYTYVQGRYDYVDLDTGTEASNMSGRAVLNVWQPLYVIGEYDRGHVDTFDVDSVAYTVSLGLHGSLTDEIDTFVEAGYMTREIESLGVTAESAGPAAALGFRGVSPGGSFEGELRYSYYWLDSDDVPRDDYGRLRFDLIWRVTRNIGVVVGGAWELSTADNLPYQAYGAGLRLSL